MSGIFRGPVILGLLIGWALGPAVPGHARAEEKVRVLIIDGQNNHNWRAMTPPMKAELERSGRFTVDVVTTPGPKASHDLWNAFRPEFSKYDVVLSNYNGEMWPEEVRKSLEEYVSNGGGLAIIHAANNAFEGWPAFNKMIGLGWRERSFRRSFDSRRRGQGCSHAEGRGSEFQPWSAARIQGCCAKFGSPDHSWNANRVDALQGRTLPWSARAGREHGDPGHGLFREGERGHRHE